MLKVFSYIYAASTSVEANGTTCDPVLTEVFVAEEDLVLVGYTMTMKMMAPYAIGNDGFCDVDAILMSRGAIGWNRWGDIGILNGCIGWNTTPAGLIHETKALSVMFPANYGITVKEGETINVGWSIHNETAGAIRFACDGLLLFRRGKVTS